MDWVECTAELWALRRDEASVRDARDFTRSLMCLANSPCDMPQEMITELASVIRWGEHSKEEAWQAVYLRFKALYQAHVKRTDKQLEGFHEAHRTSLKYLRMSDEVRSLVERMLDEAHDVIGVRGEHIKELEAKLTELSTDRPC